MPFNNAVFCYHLIQWDGAWTIDTQYRSIVEVKRETRVKWIQIKWLNSLSAVLSSLKLKITLHACTQWNAQLANNEAYGFCMRIWSTHHVEIMEFPIPFYWFHCYFAWHFCLWLYSYSLLPISIRRWCICPRVFAMHTQGTDSTNEKQEKLQITQCNKRSREIFQHHHCLVKSRNV